MFKIWSFKELLWWSNRALFLNNCRFLSIKDTVKDNSNNSSMSSKSIEERFSKLLNHTETNFPYRCGNINEVKSNLWYFKRRKLEKQLLTSTQSIPPFLYAYRDFMNALKTHDFRTIKLMLEPSFYNIFKNSLIEIEKLGGDFR